MKDYSDTSFWMATYGPYNPNPPLEGEKRVDVAVIGGGFTGLSTAFQINKEGPGLKFAL